MSNANDNFAPPKGFRFSYFENSRGQQIRYGHAKTTVEKPLGTMVLGPGYGESGEKFFELMNDLTAAGYNVYVMDWMGQGGSDRKDKNDPHKPYDVPNFMDHHCDDLHQFATKVIEVPKDQKIGYMGFSMGGHIGTRFAERYNYIFDAMSLNASYFDMNSRGVPRSAVGSVVASFRAVGKGGDYIPGGGPWSADKHDFKSNRKTSDAERHRRFVELYQNKTDIQLGDFTVDWVGNSMSSLKRVNRKATLKKIITPTHISICGKDKLVSVSAQKRAVKHLFNAASDYYPKSKHEIWIERDAIRSPWLENVKRFFEPIMQDKMEPVRIGRIVMGPPPPSVTPKRRR